MTRHELQEQDLVLLHALQIAPRASWTDAARILGVRPATLAARWERLRGSGLAWVTGYPNPASGRAMISLVEVDCLPGSRTDVIDRLAHDPRAVTIEDSARGRDLFLTVVTPDLPSLTRFVLDDMAGIPGILRQRTHLATTMYTQGAAWRLDALERGQEQAFEALAGAMAPRLGVSPPPEPGPLIDALARDGRASAADLARVVGRRPSTVRRQLPRLIASGVLSFRCEVAQVTSKWPISCTWVARVPPQEKDRTVTALGTLPELRLCISTTGDTNLMFTVWVRSLDHLMRLERLLGERLPWVGLIDSAVTLRTTKRIGWLLHPDGRCTGEVVPSTALSGL